MPSEVSAQAVEPHRFRIAVCIPCHNEADAIEKVVGDFKAALPDADIYVYDNASTDETAVRASMAGATVRFEPMKGKGHVVRRMFADIEADIFVLVDGDDTYEAAKAPYMIEQLLTSNGDMITGRRVSTDRAAYRPGHRFGNRLLTGAVRHLFGNQVSDMLSGYRVLSRRFVKSFPILSSGFEIETEMTIHALELQMGISEVKVEYTERASGTESKLRTYRDGFAILFMIIDLALRERPLWCFAIASFLTALLSILLAIPIIDTYFNTGLVPRFPTAILSMTLMLMSLLSIACGVILRMVTIGRREIKRLAYLREGSLAEYRAMNWSRSSPKIVA